MATPPNKTSRTVSAAERTCEILRALRTLDGAGVTELADHMDISKGTVHGYLSTLEQFEFVVKQDHEYRLSLKFLDYGEYVKRQIEIYDLLKEEADKLADEIDEAVQFIVEEHGWGIYLYIAESEGSVPTGATVGDRKHLHCTALGKATLSVLPSEYVDWILRERGLPQITENTITDPDDLKAELADIRDRGIAFDDQESEPGQRCVAAPLTCFKNSYVGAMSVAGPANRIDDEAFRETIPDELNSTTNAIEIRARYI